MSSLSEIWGDAQRRNLPAGALLLIADVSAQRLSLVVEGGEQAAWPLSSARLGMGSAEGSFQTPPGFHRVAERIGEGEPMGRVFRSRLAQGECWNPGSPAQAGEDLIVGRILWLEGLEPGLNQGEGQDSHDRFIYIHGTNHVEDLGSPASRGCIRLHPRAMLDLFGRIAGRETWCWIGQLDPKGGDA